MKALPPQFTSFRQVISLIYSLNKEKKGASTFYIVHVNSVFQPVSTELIADKSKTTEEGGEQVVHEAPANTGKAKDRPIMRLEMISGVLQSNVLLQAGLLEKAVQVLSSQDFTNFH